MTKLTAVILMVAIAANATGGAFADGKVRVAQTVIPEGTRFCFSPEVKGFNLLNDDYAVIMNGNRVEVRACRESRIPFNRVWSGPQRRRFACLRLQAAMSSAWTALAAAAPSPRRMAGRMSSSTARRVSSMVLI